MFHNNNITTVNDNNPVTKYMGLPSRSLGKDSLTTVYSKAPPTIPRRITLPIGPTSTNDANIAPKKGELADNALK